MVAFVYTSVHHPIPTLGTADAYQNRNTFSSFKTILLPVIISRQEAGIEARHARSCEPYPQKSLKSASLSPRDLQYGGYSFATTGDLSALQVLDTLEVIARQESIH
jgi:hypothetical protein